MKYDVIIIGGGAAGMMSAVRCASGGLKTAVIEKNKIFGRKLRITGKGRCNVTNACDNETLLSNIISGKKFLMSSFSRFSPWDTMDFFEEMGVPLKTERGNRVFPVSDDADDIADVLFQKMKSLGVELIHSKCTGIIVSDGKSVGVETESGKFFADNIICATGGVSYPKTGSTGDGFTFAKKLGHSVTPLRPCLSALETKERKQCADMMGVSLKNVTLKLYRGNKCLYEELGEMLFSHFGITGPLVLSASCYIDDPKNDDYYVKIDLKPALSEEKLDARILREFAVSPNRIISNIMHSLLPSKMIDTVLKISKIDGDTPANSVTKVQRAALIDTMKNMTFHISSFRPVDEAIVTAGGIELKEITPRTMESKFVKNLYFIGEMIDAHGFTGGFNLQIAFSTAVAAADGIKQKYGV